MTHLRSWWYRPDTFTNFGDELGHIFLELLGHEVEHVPFAESDILTTGSILQRHNRWPLRDGTIVWGTGWHKQPPRNTAGLDIRAVRGTITADALNVDVPLGDPGLLASHFWPGTIKTHRLGFVRQYVDHQHIPDAQLIDVRDDPESVCRQISECETIVSSSLHGCVVAASYGIPYMRLPNDRVVGGNTKWVDFTSSLNRPIREIQHALLERIEDL